MKRGLRGRLVGSCSSGILAAALASAGVGFVTGAPAEAADAPSDQGSQIQEIVVSAQKRSENIQDVPISMQVVNGTALEEQNLNSLATLSEITPDVHIEFHPRSGDLYIRGIGSGENQDFEQSVGTFIDDIYFGRARTIASTFLDLDSVEILKGPQSTFFGNNAIAGALNIVTAKPTDRFEGWVRALYGEYDQYALEGAINLPIDDKVAVRVAATANNGGGWIKDVLTGQEQPSMQNYAGRVQVAVHPTDDFDAILKIEGSKASSQDGIEYGELTNCPPPPPFTANGFCSIALANHVPIGVDTNENSVKPGAGIDLRSTDYELTANYRQWGQTFTSVTGFTNYHFAMNLDGDNSPVPLLTSQAPEEYNQWSQEFRVTSPSDQPITYLAGGYFQTDHLVYTQNLTYFFLSPTIASIPPLAALDPYLPLGQRTSLSQMENDYSVFGSVDWHVTDQLKLTGGIRGSWVYKDYNWNNFFGRGTQTYGGIDPLPGPLQPLAGALGIGTAGQLEGNRADHAWLPSAKIQYQLTPEAMAYFSYAGGFKAGGFNGADQSAQAANLPFAPEHVAAFETGIKTKWFDDTVLFNLDAFHSDYEALQVAVNVNTGGNIRSLVQNAGRSVTHGVELETEWAVTHDFRLAANATYDDAHYVRYPNVTATQLQQLFGAANQDLSGRPTDFAPKWSASLTGSYTQHLPGEFELTGKVTGFFTSSYYMDGTDDPTVRQTAYTRLDAQLTLLSPDGHWAVDLIGKNLTDRTILTFAQAAPIALGSTAVQREMPRNIAGQIRYQW